MRRAWSVIMIILAGCFTPPTGIRAAEDALAAAEAEGAEEYLPIEHATAEDLLGSAREELARQETVSIHRRSYRRANRLLARAEDQAHRLKERTIARRAEVERIVVPEMQMLMVSVQEIETMGVFEVDALDEAIDNAAQAYRDGEYLDALIIVRDAQSDADRLLVEGVAEPGA
jgi:hypothetical protein